MLASLAGTPGAALAEELVPPATSTPTPTPTPVAARAGAPAITSPSDGVFVGSSNTSLAGTRSAGQDVQVLDPAGGDPLCFVPDDGGTEWACTGIPLPNGPSIALRVVVAGEPDLWDEITVAVLGEPTVSGGARGQDSSNGMVRGTGYPGASVTARLSGGGQCVSTVDDAGDWVCLFTGPLQGGDRQVAASQSTGYSSPSSSNASEPVNVFFDVDAPTAPLISAPTSGDRVPLGGADYSGTGETGARVTVFAGAYSVCSATVQTGAWRCSGGGVAAGSYSVTAVQQDAAGNVGPGSSPIRVAYGPRPASNPKPSTAGPTAAPATPAAPVPPQATAEATPLPPTTAPEAHGPGRGTGGTTGDWDDATAFTSAVAPPGSAGPFPWLQAVLWALGALVLVAMPARLLAGTISRSRDGRPLWHRMPLTGRNRAGEEFEVAPAVRLNRWLLGGAALLAAATLIMLSGPVTDRPAYLRLLVAVVIGLVVVNAAGTLVPLWWSSRVLHTPASATFLPRYLLLVGVAALASRVFEIEPALVFGLLGSVAVADGAPAHRRGQLAAVRAGSLILLAVLAWLALGALPGATGFVGALAAETLNAVVLAAIGSVVLVLVPLGSTSGRRILAWSPPIWAGLTVLANTFFFAVLSPVVASWYSDGTVTFLWAAVAVFAALCVGAWAWQRFVVPALR
ncbi:hypothetical protein E3T33_07980 [Cryobacterium sp. TMT1-2-1]|uniref:hypothetical protein n=1 Tax=Cryobacterium sp. TMT1-2-1 TaxID=1259232 RepID=UPI00106DC0CB|nr:hypothetical protein [Cryobacterium sp. TMT1-2-1]TFD44973.1 hypothetical protein E3T33_07980 [Cryobacterium sp. TMT1-2-1]